MNSIKKFPKNRKKSVPLKHLNLHFNRTFEKKTSLIVDFLSFIFLFIAEEEPECYDENSVQFDFRNPGTINGLPSMIEREKDDLTLVLKGWTAMRDYAGGYVRGDSGTALVEVTGLEPHRNYDFGVSVYCSDHCANHYLLILPDGNKIVPTMHETCCLNLQTNERLSCDVGIRGCTGASFDPVHTGVYMSDSAGKIVFGFEHNKSDSNPMVKFSGIKIRPCKVEKASITPTTTTITTTTTTAPTTTSKETSYCPDSYPFAYLNGDYCCQSGYEKNDPSKDGELCDGSKIQIDSKCCLGNQYNRCESPPCENNQGQSL